jgi:hypothetical protein
MNQAFSPVRILVTLLVVVVAAIVAWQLWVYYMLAPWTRDGAVRADIVQVAPDVSGLVAAVDVRDNESVAVGQALFEVDPARFTLALAAAKAGLARAQATLDNAQRDAEPHQQRRQQHAIDIDLAGHDTNAGASWRRAKGGGAAGTSTLRRPISMVSASRVGRRGAAVSVAISVMARSIAAPRPAGGVARGSVRYWAAMHASTASQAAAPGRDSAGATRASSITFSPTRRSSSTCAGETSAPAAAAARRGISWPSRSIIRPESGPRS